MLALTRTLPIQDSALSINSPKGMLLYGEVGRGKSMLLDLFADSLPSRKKRRWHFNAFMLQIFRRLEKLRLQRSTSIPGHLQGLNQQEHEHSVLSLARDTISTSPILFLDEFQLPDRAANKLLNSFLTSFFHLGGVLIATSNRMPDELAKAAGVEYVPRLGGLGSAFGWTRRRAESERAASTDFGAFLDVLKARCEIWEMEGDRDWRRDDEEINVDEEELEKALTSSNLAQETSLPASGVNLGAATSDEGKSSPQHPLHYHLISVTPPNASAAADSEVEWNRKIESFLAESASSAPPPTWSPSYLSVYGRQVPVPASTPSGYSRWSFADLCAANLGSADYISLASTFHTLILDSVPILTLIQKNEARRFITLLDALYESRCRLLMRADAPPDALFFPETQHPTVTAAASPAGDEVYQETLAEIYQDRNSPFRPNVSSYREDGSAASTRALLNPKMRSVLADEDADFGPVYGNGRGHGASTGLEETERRQRQRHDSGPDFTRTATLTGEDERFAYKRARSRIWEMCGERWWRERPVDMVAEWWRPMAAEGRFWENRVQKVGGENSTLETVMAISAGVDGSHDGRQKKKGGDDGVGKDEQDGLFRYGASPFRTRMDPPPKFGWQHAWGMVTWGRKAGEWGKGVQGKRDKNKDGER
jgi:peroxisome-assembly ATPase